MEGLPTQDFRQSLLAVRCFFSQFSLAFADFHWDPLAVAPGQFSAKVLPKAFTTCVWKRASSVSDMTSAEEPEPQALNASQDGLGGSLR